MNKQSKKVTESPELIEELYDHWLWEYYLEGEDSKDKTFAYNKYVHYRDLLEEMGQ